MHRLHKALFAENEREENKKSGHGGREQILRKELRQVRGSRPHGEQRAFLFFGVYDPCGEKHIRGTNQKHGKNFQRKFVF